VRFFDANTIAADYDWEVSGNNIFTGHGGSYPTGGYLGIGTATPARIVHIIGDDSNPEEMVIEDEGGGTYSYLHMCIRNKTGSGSMSYSFSQQAGSSHFAGIDLDPDNEQLIIRNNYHTSNGFDNGVITFMTRNASGSGERMRVDNDGNVGIGTTSPQARLSLGGATGAQGGFAIGDGTAISTTDGSRRSIQIATDNNYGGINDNHTGYLIYSIMQGGWTLNCIFALPITGEHILQELQL
jgi:hypothetical protein